MTEYQSKIRHQLTAKRDVLEDFKHINFSIEYGTPKNFYGDFKNAIFICRLNNGNILTYNPELDVFVHYELHIKASDSFVISGAIFKSIFDINLTFGYIFNAVEEDFYRKFFRKWSSDLVTLPLSISENLFDNSQIPKKLSEEKQERFPKNRFVVVATKNKNHMKLLYDRLTGDYVYFSGVKTEVFLSFSQFIKSDKITYNNKRKLVEDIELHFNIPKESLYPSFSYYDTDPFPIFGVHHSAVIDLNSRLAFL